MVEGSLRSAISPPLRVRCALAILLCGSAAAAQDLDDQAHTAACIDRYNTDPAFRQSQRDIPENPGLILRLRPVGLGIGSADGTELAADSGPSYGGALEADTLVTLISSGHTRTGLTAGLSAMGYWTADHSYAFGGEIRFGIGRRRYGVPLYEPWLLRKAGPSSCHFERIDLGIDLLRWRLQWLTATDAAGRPTTFVTGISTLVPSLRLTYADSGWKILLSPLDFRLAPSVSWGMSAQWEGFFFTFVSVSATAGFYLDHAYLTVNAGLRFELFEGVSAN